MAVTYPLRIVSQEEQVYDGPVQSIIVPGALGYLGVLAHHAPLLTSLSEGTLSILDAEDVRREFRVKGGILEVSRNDVVILVDDIEEPSPN